VRIGSCSDCHTGGEGSTAGLSSTSLTAPTSWGVVSRGISLAGACCGKMTRGRRRKNLLKKYQPFLAALQDFRGMIKIMPRRTSPAIRSPPTIFGECIIILSPILPPNVASLKGPLPGEKKARIPHTAKARLMPPRTQFHLCFTTENCRRHATQTSEPKAIAIIINP